MGGILRVAAAVQMALGAVGFLGTAGYYAATVGQAGVAPDVLPTLALLVLSSLLFTAGGMFWMAVRNTYPPPRPDAHAASNGPRPGPGGSPMAAVLRVISLVLMAYGSAGAAAVFYLAFRTATRDARGADYLWMVGFSLLGMHTVGVGGVIWGVQRLAYPPRPAPPPSPAG